MNDFLNKEIELLKPSKMLDNLPYGTVFQQWFKGEPSDTFFLTCGPSEKRVITFWWDDENRKYKVGTDNKKSLREYVSSVKVFKINAEIKINAENKLLLLPSDGLCVGLIPKENTI